MSEFEAEVKKAEQELNEGISPVDPFAGQNGTDEFLGNMRTQAEEYGRQVKDAASKAYELANERFGPTVDKAGEKLRELADKDPRELVEDAKEFARQKPGQTILISAAVGLVLGLLVRGKRN
ncbi:MAG TPA: hypothetical protein VL501_03135 [Pyrinomonadaceae bacterium]|nr:hypothetical protein [Pyrinomonadaceae bacterium]